MNWLGHSTHKPDSTNPSFNIPVFFTEYLSYLGLLLLAIGLLLINDSIGKMILDFSDQLFEKSFNRTFRITGFQMTGSCLILFGILMIFIKFCQGHEMHFTKRHWFLLTTSSIILFYWYNLLEQAVNVPITDDYFSILQFMNTYVHANGISEQFAMIRAPYVETRNSIMKLVVVSLYTITGEVNFRALIICVNLAWCGVVFFIYRTMDAIPFKRRLMIPALFLVFQFSFYDAQVWATAGMHTIFTLFLVLAACYFIRFNTPLSFVAAIFISCLAAFSYGNGLLIFPIGLAMLVIQQRKKELLLFGFVFLGVLFFYFNGYHAIRSASFMMTLNPLKIIAYCLVFLGSSFQFMYRLELPFIIGSILLILFIWFVKRKYYSVNPYNFSILIYVIGSALIASIYRLGDAEGIRQALAIRYVVYSIIGIICSFVAMAELNPLFFKKRIFWGLLIGASIYYVASGFFFFPETVLRKNKLQSFVNAIQTNSTIMYSPPVIPEGADSIVHVSMQLSIYHP